VGEKEEKSKWKNDLFQNLRENFLMFYEKKIFPKKIA
jgi:hypothetical protein